MIIYETVCLVNNKKYIGQHICGNHCNQQYPCNYLGSGRAFKQASKKYGKESFVRKILAYAKSEKELNLLEQFYVTLIYCNRKDTYNLKEGGGSRGRHSEKTKEKISNSSMGRKHTREHKRYLRSINLGRTHTEETKRKIGDINRGLVMTEEQKKKISDALTGFRRPKKTKKKISEGLKEYHRIRKEKGLPLSQR